MGISVPLACYVKLLRCLSPDVAIPTNADSLYSHIDIYLCVNTIVLGIVLQIQLQPKLYFRYNAWRLCILHTVSWVHKAAALYIVYGIPHTHRHGIVYGIQAYLVHIGRHRHMAYRIRRWACLVHTHRRASIRAGRWQDGQVYGQGVES